MNQYGVDEKIWQHILDTCFNNAGVNAAILYGSRARGDYKQGSDIDVAIDAPRMTDRAFSNLWNQLDDLPIIYTLDIVHLQRLANNPLIHAIRKDGVVFKPPDPSLAADPL